MYHYRFEKAARRNRRLAIFWALFLHILLVAGIAYGAGAELSDYIPDALKTMIGMEEGAPASVQAEVPQP